MLSLIEITKGYDYFFYKKYQYIQKHPNTCNKILETFVSEVKSNFITLGPQTLFNFLLFQYIYWEGLVVSTEQIQFSHIFGKKATQRYLSRNQEYDWQLYNTELTEKYKFNIEHFKDYIVLTIKPNDSLPLEINTIRSIAVKREEPLLYCSGLTDFYLESNEYCKICRSQVECKKVKSKLIVNRKI